MSEETANAALASINELIADYDAKLAAAEQARAALEQRLAQIGELAHLEAEQPTEEQQEQPPE